MLTTDRNDPNLHEKEENGQNKAYLVMTDEEIKAGFVRPVRRTYVHVGRKYYGFKPFENPEYIDGKEYVGVLASHESYKDNGKVYVGTLLINDSNGNYVGGRFATQEEVDQFNKTGRVGGCGVATTMNQVIAETYAANPKFYGATFCVGCGTHLPVSEFSWEDGTIVGS